MIRTLWRVIKHNLLTDKREYVSGKVSHETAISKAKNMNEESPPTITHYPVWTTTRGDEESDLDV